MTIPRLLLLLDSRIENKEFIISCLEPNTDYLFFDYYTDTYKSIISRVEPNEYTCISIAQHNYNGHYFYFLEKETSPLPIINSIATEDPLLTTWNEFILFLAWFKENRNTQYFDFLACDIWANPDWVYIINRIRSRGIYIRASVDHTGKHGNFILESDDVNTIGLYFTEDIKQYTHDLFITYPAPPIINTITPQDKSLIVYLMELDDGGSPITKYMYSLNDGSYVDFSVSSLDPPFTIAGLTNGVSYIVKIKAFNGTYESYESEPWFPVIPYAEINEPIILNITLTYPATLHIYGENVGGVDTDIQNIDIIFPPSAPIITDVVAGNEKAMIEFEQTITGGSPILYYKYALNGSNIYEIAQETSTPIIINGLDNGTTYTVSLIAYNGYVESLPSAYSSEFTPYLSMDAPIITSITPANQQMTVYFTHNTNGYNVSYYTYTLDGGQTHITTTQTTSPFIITGLVNAKQYSFTMTGHTDTLESLPSNTVINIVPYTIPDTPIITRIEPYDKSLHIYFDASVNTNGRPIINFIYSLNGGVSYTSASQTSNPIIITGLENGTTYYIAVKSLNTGGYSAQSNIIQAIPANVPSTPIITNVNVVNVNATITFSPPQTNGSSIIKYQYKITNQNFIDIPALINGNSFTLYNLPPANYSVFIRAINAIGISPVSNGASFTTLEVVPPPAPIITKIIYVRNTTTATIKFTQPASVLPVYTYLVSINGETYKKGAFDGTFIYVPNLIVGQTYSFRIKAQNEFGTSLESNTSESITIIKSPSIPYIWKIDTFYDKTDIYFTKINDNGSPIIRVQYNLNSSGWITANTTNSPITLSQLPNNSYNTITIRAINLAGESHSSTLKTFRVLFQLPNIVDPPEIFVDISSIVVNPILPNIVGNIPITAINYIIYRNGVPDPVAISVPPIIPFTIYNTPPNMNYSVQISITTPIGTTTYSTRSRTKAYYASYPDPPVIYTIHTYNTTAKIYVIEPDYKGAKPNITYWYSLNKEPFVDSYTNDATMPIICDISTNKPYTLEIKAQNEVGMSSVSDTSIFISSFGVPKRPYFAKPVMTRTGLRAPMWHHQNTGGLPVLGFKFSINGGDYLPIYNSNTELIISSFQPNTSYIIRLVSYNINGISEPYARLVRTLP